ncbi:MAG TPA: protein phosphatase CheZ [Sedimenticola sp.]|nr:protein phosphatase CheZ [Sedimenticola sp.]
MDKCTERDERLAQARALVASLEGGDDVEADRIIQNFRPRVDDALFQEVGRLTRELHEAIIGFVLDDDLVQVTRHEIPDAAERLQYVIDMTEQAANTTLKAVEESIPVSEELADVSNRLAGEWDRFRDRKLELADFRALSTDIGDFLALSSGHSKKLHDSLTEILMAQSYQDLTGQIIRRVIGLVRDVEEKLVRLVAISGASRKPVEKKAVELEGPAVPNIEQGDMIDNQNDVDDLLSSLGF